MANAIIADCGFHYVIQKKGQVVGDVVGTFHENKEDSQLNSTLIESIKQAKKVAFEMTVSDLYELGKLQKDEVDDNIKHEYVEYHEKHFSQADATPYTPDSEEEIPQLYPSRGTESLILKTAIQAGKMPEQISLETIEERVRLDQYIAVNSRMGLSFVQERTADLLEAYQNGDEELMQTVLKWSEKNSPAYCHFIYDQRNILMADRSVQLIRQATPRNRILIAVGSLHLFGDHSILSLIKKGLGDDYSIQKVMFKYRKLKP